MEKLFGVIAAMWRWLYGAVEIVSVNDRPELLGAAYKIYRERFAPTEIETQDVLEGYLKTNWWKMFVAIRRGQVVGGIHLNFLESRINAAVVEHIYVRRDLECRGIGSALFAYAEAEVFPKHATELVFLEMEDPALMTPEEIADVESIGVSLARRVMFWLKRGFMKANGPYLQGILEGASDGCYNLALLMKWLNPYKPRQIPVDDYIEVIRAFAATYLDCDPDEDPFFTRVVCALRAQPELKNIEFIDATTDRTFHRC